MKDQRRRTKIWAVLLTFSFAGCAPKSDETASVKTAVEQKPVAAAQAAVEPAAASTVKGRVGFDGPVPAPESIPVRGNPECAALHEDGSVLSEKLLVQNGLVQNAFVYVKKGLEGRSFAPPAEPLIIENKKCVYVPHVSGVQAGQPIHLVNGDATLHNVHAYPKFSKGWNLGLPFQGMKQTKTFSAPEVMVPLKCDVHPWMIGYVGVLPHPYFSISDATGSFELKDLPPGEYTLEVWHETLGTRETSLTLAAGETKEIEFRFA